MRRPSSRSLAGGAAGIVVGVIGGIGLTSLSAAGARSVGPAAQGVDAAHVPPVLTLAGETVRLRYAIVCSPRDDGRPCDGSGEVYARPGQSGPFERFRLARGDDSSEGRYFTELPQRIAASAGGFSYYAVLRDDATGATLTVPSGGAAAPQRSQPLRGAIAVELGPHDFGRTRKRDARPVEAPWGSGTNEAGLAGTRGLGFVGPSSFDVSAGGVVTLLDEVNRRVLRWSGGQAEATSLAISGGLADFAVEENGVLDVLEPPNRLTAAPVLRSFHRDGTVKWAQQLADRTWAKLVLGPSGPTVQQQPSEEWMPIAEHGLALGRVAQAARARLGRPLGSGRELVLERRGAGEIRIAEVAGTTVVRGWRVHSSTPLGEVQLAEPLGERIVVVTKIYTDERSEDLVLVLGPRGVTESFAVEPHEWAEAAPLARFRLAGSALYQLGSDASGAFVDRFDLEVR